GRAARRRSARVLRLRLRAGDWARRARRPAPRAGGRRPRAPGLSGNVRRARDAVWRDWPTLDNSRVPYRLYHDLETYQGELERIFRGPTWNFLGLEAEMPNPRRFRYHRCRRPRVMAAHLALYEPSLW